MPKYYILYSGSVTRNMVFQTDVTKTTEQEARDWFTKFFPSGNLELIRKGKEYSSTEIKRKANSLKYGK